MSVTVAVMAIYIVNNPENIQRSTFRGLVALLVFSWIYDFLSIMLLEDSVSKENEEDGGHLSTLRYFTRFFSYISLIYKFVLVLIFWKDSLDFAKIIRGVNKKPAEDIDAIVNRYDANML